MRRAAWVIILLAGAVSGACEPGSQPVGPVDQLTMFVSNTPVFLDAAPGPDGVRVNALYFFQASRPEPVQVSGALELLLFDGVVTLSTAQNQPPLHTWRFGGTELPAYLAKDRLGWRYRFVLPWGDTVPRGDKVTVVARYQPSGGMYVWSAPVTVLIKNP